MLNPALIREHFALVGGALHRKLVSGALKPVKTLQNGVLVSVVGGKTYRGVDVAWVLHYRSAPMFQVFTLNRDPFDMSAENVVAGRLGRWRFRPVPVVGGFRHNRRAKVFSSVEACFDDWLLLAREFYAKDHQHVRSLEIQRDAQLPPVDYVRPTKAATPGSGFARMGRALPKPPKPRPEAGKRAFWYVDQWVVVPEACHVSDDYRERCRKTLRGAVRFEFDPMSEMTIGYDLAGEVVA